MTVAQVLSALEAEVTEDGYILLGRLRVAVDELDFWPERTFAAALEAFGGAVYARGGRTAKALERRINHARRVWAEKYGPLSTDQEDYADAVLASAIRRGARDGQAADGTLYSFVQAEIARRVNHEEVDAGFKRRAAAKIDVAAELAEALA